MVGRSLEGIVADMRGFWRSLVSDSQLRWLGPEKGVMHLATAAVVNAVWACGPRCEGKPLWKLLVDLSPEEIVGCVDFRYIADALAPEEALDLLRHAAAGAARETASSPQATRRTRPPPAGSATTTRRSSSSCARRLPTDSRTSR